MIKLPDEFSEIRIKKAKLWIDRVMLDMPGMKEAKTCAAILEFFAEVQRLNATAQPVSDDKSSLLTYLNECSEQVSRWPEWKKKGSDVAKLIKEMDDFELGFVNGWVEIHKQNVIDGRVKCSERMPPIGKRVLIPTSGLGEAIEAVRFESNKFNRFGIEVVADYWMTLPAAPGGQDD